MWQDRVAAGKELAAVLTGKTGPGTVVFGLPRGGVVVAAEVAGALGLPLDVVITKKIGAPGNPEYAIASVASDGKMIVDEAAASAVGANRSYLDEQANLQKRMIADREAFLKPVRPSFSFDKIDALIVDDGLATGLTALAAVAYLRRTGARRVDLAVPVASEEAAGRLSDACDNVTVILAPPAFGAVGAYYADFSQTDDETVFNLLSNANGFGRSAP